LAFTAYPNIRGSKRDALEQTELYSDKKMKGIEGSTSIPSFIVDIPNSLESKSFASQKESTDFPSDPGPKPDRAYNNREGNNWGPDSTLGNKQQEALPRTEEEEERSQNGLGARLKPIRLKDKGLTEPS
jgi:hypothetical protein